MFDIGNPIVIGEALCVGNLIADRSYASVGNPIVQWFSFCVGNLIT